MNFHLLKTHRAGPVYRQIGDLVEPVEIEPKPSSLRKTHSPDGATASLIDDLRTTPDIVKFARNRYSGREMTGEFFFGYGSLVNRRTHDYPDVAPARLEGWRREWCSTSLRDVSYLSARPEPGIAIEGLIASVPGQDWDALDRREGAYDRHKVTPEVRHALSVDVPIQVYKVVERHRCETSVGPILLSYLDVVVQGFLDHYGEQGVADFFDTTDGWHRPVLDDRADPIYPRHQKLSHRERALVDDHLTGLAAVVLDLE